MICFVVRAELRCIKLADEKLNFVDVLKAKQLISLFP